MSEGAVLYWVYRLYELEGIPPYPSHFTPVEFRISNWLSITDTLLLRTEKIFMPAEPVSPALLEWYMVRMGTGSVQVRREYWEGQLFHESREPIAQSTLSFDDWLAQVSAKGRQFVEKARKGGRVTEIREEIDNRFGQVQVITIPEVVHGSDLYTDRPLEIMYKFDMALMRLVEQMETVTAEDNSRLIHRHQQLLDWAILKPGEAPPNVFDPEFILGL